MESCLVDYIVDHKVGKGKHVYEVKWVGFNEWLEAGRMEPMPIRDFHNQVCWILVNSISILEWGAY